MLIIDGQEVPVPGRRVVSFRDDPSVRLEMPEDGRRRPDGSWIRQVIVHTTQGIPGGADHRPQKIIAGVGPSSWDRLNIAAMWRRDDRYSGAHIVVDFDGTIYCLCDLVREMAFHATAANAMSIGIEIKQGAAHAELYSDELEAAADVIDVITAHPKLAIQRQIPSAYHGHPFARLDEDHGKGRDVVGVFGHRDQTNRRGAGDPGDAIMDVLDGRRYERFNFASGEDLLIWKERQRLMRLRADGVPGPATCAALAARGFESGLWACPPPGLAEFV